MAETVCVYINRETETYESDTTMSYLPTSGSLATRVVLIFVLLGSTWSPLVLGGGLQVLESAALFGHYGLRVELAPTCVVDHLMVPTGQVNTNQVACRTITALDVEIVNPGATFLAGQRIILENGVVVFEDAPFEATVDPLVNTAFAYVQHNKPDAEQIYDAKFYLRLDGLILEVGDEIEHFAGYSADGELQFKLVLRRNGVLDENRLAIVAREDGGGLVEHPTDFLLPEGYNVIRVHWEAGAGTGQLGVAVGDGVPLSGLGNLGNSLSRIDHVKWGAINGTISTTTGFLELDEFSTIVELPGDDDCQPYMPTESNDGQSGSWTVPNDRNEHRFSTPGDPGGGYATVTLSTNAPAIPWLTLTNASDGGGAISAGGAAGTSNEQEVKVVFEVAPGQTYKQEVLEQFNAPLEEHPWDYSVAWSYTSKVDCYEPNNAVANSWPDPVDEAKAIPIGKVIEAYSIAGYLLNGIGSGPHTYDWYKFTLTNTETISVELLEVPDDQAPTLRLFSETGAVTLQAGTAVLGQTVTMGPALVAPGTWYIESHWFFRGSGVAHPHLGEEIPDHFDTPYRLVVKMGEDDQSFWDSFETGDRSQWDSEAP